MKIPTELRPAITEPKANPSASSCNLFASGIRTDRIATFLTILLAIGLVPAAWADDPVLVTVFENPTPVSGDAFGYTMCAVGTDRVIITALFDGTAAEKAVSAYLFTTNGALLSTFLNPSAAPNDDLGRSAPAVLGDSQIVMGVRWDDTLALNCGAAYLFSTNGSVTATFNNPTPAALDSFGESVAAIGADRVLIGAPNDISLSTYDGAAYLFSTAGQLLMTYLPPIPGGRFGRATASLGNTHVLIGAPSRSKAFVYTTDGVLETTFDDPSAQTGSNFGSSLTSLGDDRVVIGADKDDTHGTDAGIAYLFSTNGTLLTTFVHPSPNAGDGFGYPVAAVGTDRVLIGAYRDDHGAADAGAAYLFSTNGTLLASIYNPNPVAGGYFGIGLASLGDRHFLIGAPKNHSGGTDAGAAYLYALPATAAPVLSITATAAGNVSISWTPDTPGYVLQIADDLSLPEWTDSSTGSTNPVSFPSTPEPKYFQLIKR